MTSPVKILGPFKPNIFWGYRYEASITPRYGRARGLRVKNLQLQTWGFVNGYVGMMAYMSLVNNATFGEYVNNQFVEDEDATFLSRRKIFAISPKIYFHNGEFFAKEIVDNQLRYLPLEGSSLAILPDDYLVEDETAWRFRNLCGHDCHSLEDFKSEIKESSLIWFGKAPTEEHQHRLTPDDVRKSIVYSHPLLDVRVYRLADLQ
jgi:hypothetical protein